MKIIIILLLLAYTSYKVQKWYYTKNTTTTFVVKLKSGVTHRIDLPENITRDELMEIITHIASKEDIVGIYNLFGKELEYAKGQWLEK